MALVRNADGSVTVSDDTGRVPSFVVPAEQAPTLVPSWLPTPDVALGGGRGPIAAPQLRQPTTMPGPEAPLPPPLPPDVSLSNPVPGPMPAPLSAGAVAGPGGAPPAAPLTPGQQAVAGTANAATVGAILDAAAGAGGTGFDPTSVPGGTALPPKFAPGKPAADALGTVNPKGLADNAPAQAGDTASGDAEALPYGGDKASAALAADLAFAPGGYTAPQPARDVKRAFTVQKGIKNNPQTLAELQAAFANRANISNAGAQAVPTALEQVAATHAQAAEEARQEVAAIRNRQRAQEAELQGRMKYLDQHIARINNLADRDVLNEYLGNQNFGTRLMVGLGALGSALTGAPNFAFENIKMELNAALQQQKSRLEMGHETTKDALNAYAQMRATYTSPEAADNAALALMTQATQQTVLHAAARVSKEETRTKYFDIAGQLGIEAALAKQAAEQAEADKIAESWQHKEAVQGGYTPPRRRSMLERIALGGKKGITPDQVMELARGHAMPAKGGAGKTRGEVDLMKAVAERQVVLPDGKVLYAPDSTTQRQVQSAITDGKLFVDTTKKLLKLGDGKLTSLVGTDYATAGVLVNENIYYLKNSLLGEALNSKEAEFFQHMTGSDMLNYLTTDASAQRKLEQALEGANARMEAQKSKLYTKPFGGPNDTYAKTQTKPAGAVQTD